MGNLYNILGAIAVAGSMVLCPIVAQGQEYPVIAEIEQEEQYFMIGNVRFDMNERVSYDEARAFVEWTYDLYASLPQREIPATDEMLEYWTEYLLPQYEAEDIVDDAFLPRVVEFTELDYLELETEALGVANCTGSVMLSDDYQNPGDWIYNSPGWPFVLAHELAHQEARMCTPVLPGREGFSTCFVDYTSQMENSANLSALEVMAGLVREEYEAFGKSDTLYPFLWGLREIALRNFLYVAMRDHREEDYRQFFRRHFPNDRYMQSRAYSIVDKDHPERQDRWDFARAYGGLNVKEMLIAYFNDGWTKNTVQYNPDSGKIEIRLFELDDLFYVMDHLEEIVEATIDGTY